MLFFSDNFNIPYLIQSIIEVLTRHHVSLCDLYTHKLNTLADEMYSTHLITTKVHRSLTFNDIINDFKSAMVFKREHSQFKDHCAKFLSVFTKLGGHKVDF